jgi:hypothetical protein
MANKKYNSSPDSAAYVQKIAAGTGAGYGYVAVKKTGSAAQVANYAALIELDVVLP